MENNNEKLILVYYIGVYGLDQDEIPEYIQRIKERISLPGFDGNIIFIPVYTQETRIECINPKYVTDKELIKKHTELVKNLEVELEHQLELIKINNDELKNKINKKDE